MSEFIKKCNAVIKLNSINFDYPESQIHRTNGKNLNCNRHKKIFNKYNIIPEYCFGCFKVQINFKKVSQLIKLFFIFDKLKLPNNNIRKCFIELRKNIKGNYKALIYCSNLDEAKKILNIINDILNKSLTNFILDIKRGCTEFNFSLPGYKDINKINEITYDNKWKNKEKLMDMEIENGSKKGKKFFIEYNSGTYNPNTYLYEEKWERSERNNRRCVLERSTSQYLGFEYNGIKESGTYRSLDKFNEKVKKYFKF